MSSKNSIFDCFDEIENRIKKITGKDKQKELIEILETSEATYSRRKREKNFKIDWAFTIAQKYGLSTDWIMTGQGPKRANEKLEVKPEEKTIQLLDEWLKEISKDEPDKKIWFRYQIEEAFPSFKEWLKRKEQQNQDNKNRKVV